MSRTGTGWVHAMLTGEEAIITVEVTPPTGAAIGDSRDVLIQASASGQTDVVKATATVKAVSVPDVSVICTTNLNASQIDTDEGWVGIDQFTPQTSQELSTVTSPAKTERYSIRVKNVGEVTDSFDLHLSPPANGWTLHLFDAAGQTIGTTTPSIWTLPSLAAGDSITLTLEAESAANTTSDNNTSVTATGGVNTDTVVIHDQLQWMTKIQWSRDNTTWADAAANTIVEAEPESTIGLRAVKAHPDLPWPDAYPIGPYWVWQNARVDGTEVWLQTESATSAAGEEATAYLGTSSSVKIRVLPACDVSLNVSRSLILAGAGPQTLKSTTVTMKATDDQNAGVAGIRLLLKASDSSGAAVGSWHDVQGAAATAPLTLTTDANGVATAVWDSDASAGSVVFDVVALDDNDLPRPISTSLKAQTILPYSRVDFGDWEENNGAWSRQVKASTWFMGQKVGGHSVALSTVVHDAESGTLLPEWISSAPLDATSGTTDANGDFVTVQRWTPTDPDTWLFDFAIDVTSTLSN